MKLPRPVRVVNYETDHELDYEETRRDSDEYAYSIKTQNQRIQKHQGFKYSSTTYHLIYWSTRVHQST